MISIQRYRYDFDLRTGHSETGMKACTYAVQLRPNDESDEGEDEQVWVEAPEGGTNWRLIELRPVSEGESSGLERIVLPSRPKPL